MKFLLDENVSSARDIEGLWSIQRRISDACLDADMVTFRQVLLVFQHLSSSSATDTSQAVHQ